MITKYNLYANGAIYKFDGGTSMLIRNRFDIEGKETDKYHTLRIDDTLDYLANIYYKDVMLWWLIAEANEIFNPLDLTEYIGQQLLIPNVDRLRL